MPWTFTMLAASLSKGAYEDLTSSKAERFEMQRMRRSARRAPGLQMERFPRDEDEMSAESEELIPETEERDVPDPLPGLHPDDTGDLDIDRLMDDPSYYPLHPLPREPPELPGREADFKRARHAHEMEDRPHHVRFPQAYPSDNQDMVTWCVEETNSFVLGVEIDAPASEAEWRKILKDPSKFTAKSIQKGAEISWHKLNPLQKKAMSEAKTLEVTSWVSNKVVEKALGFVPKHRLMRMRWVLVLKGTDTPGRVKAKARIVILGFSDPEGEFLDTAAPTLSKRSKHLLLNLATHRRWHVIKADAKAAFLQGSESQRARGVFATPVPELQEALKLGPQDSVRLLRAAYGLVNAPREWYHDVANIAQGPCGMKRLRCEPCLWVCKDGDQVVGAMGTHVDDFLLIGDESNGKWLQTVQTLYDSLKWSPWEPSPFQHCGINLSQESDFGFRMDHAEYCSQIKQITISKEGEKISPDELSQARAVLGAIQWRVQQTGPQHAAKLSLLQSALPNGTKETLHQINKLVREVYAQKDLSISVQQLDAVADKDLVMIAWTDAAVGNRPDLSSTGAYVVGLAHKQILDGVRSPVNLISWKSGKLPRVARSSLSAELQSLAEGNDELMFCRALWSELLGHDLCLEDPAASFKKIDGALVIDAKSVFDAYHKGDGASSAFSMKDKHSALELLALQDSMGRNSTQLLWVSSDAQLSDGLTKSSAQDAFKAFMMKGQRWNVRFDPGFVAAKKKKMATSTPLPPELWDHELIPESWQNLISQRRNASAKSFGACNFFCFEHERLNAFASARRPGSN